MPFKIIRNDITKVHADAIVNSANPDPIAAAGTESAIYEAAGFDELLSERMKIGLISPGSAAISPAFSLHAKYVIHTVAPEYIDGSHGEEVTLRSCYRNSLLLAEEYGCNSVAFPLLASGIYGYPKGQALRTASEEIRLFLNTMNTEMSVILVVFDKDSVRLSASFYEGLESYINEEYVEAQTVEEYGISLQEEVRTSRRNQNRRKAGSAASAHIPICYERSDSAQVPEHSGISEKKVATLDDILKNQGESFHHMLFRLIDEKQLKDSDVYKKTNISRQNFSKIRSNSDIRPKKGTVLELSLALNLNIDQTTDLLASAGYAFSPGNKADLLVRYFIEHGKYDINEIMDALYDYHLPELSRI